MSNKELIENKIGKVHLSSNSTKITVVEYYSYGNCTVKFECGVLSYNRYYGDVINKRIKDLNYPNIANKGFLGFGDYNFKDNKQSYKVWSAMVRRCDEKDSTRQLSYHNVTVCEEWLNFQNFAKWWYENYNSEKMQGWQLDKDILVKGNKIYSPETCCFVPQEINNLFRVQTKSKNDNCPRGVCYLKRDKLYEASIPRVENVKRVFKTIEEAFIAHKKGKEDYIKQKADQWKDLIDPRVYQAMYNYQVEITD